jgi:hypothetical protein
MLTFLNFACLAENLVAFCIAHFVSVAFRMANYVCNQLVVTFAPNCLAARRACHSFCHIASPIIRRSGVNFPGVYQRVLQRAQYGR